MNKFLCRIRQWLFNRRLQQLLKKLADAEEKLRHIEIAKKYLIPTQPALPIARATKHAKAKRGDIPIRITYD